MINLLYYHKRIPVLGLTGYFIPTLLFSLTIIIPIISPIHAETEPSSDSPWTVLSGDDLQSDPTAQKILKNIEIFYEKLEELKNPQSQMTEQQKLVEAQRKLAEQRLEEELSRMHDEYKDFTSRAAFAKYVNKKPEIYHDYYWSLFEYMYNKVTAAREARDKILENGGSFQDAQRIFIQNAKMPVAERIDYHNEMIIKYNLLNKISNMDDFNDLPIETKRAFSAYANAQIKAFTDNTESEVVIHDESEVVTISSSHATEAVELVTVSNAYEFEDATLQETTKEEPAPNYEQNMPVNSESQVESQPVVTSIDFNGKTYVQEDMDSMDSVSAFTLSAWVRPDYSKGSAEFTILSKEGAFALTINNNKWPQQIAKFSVFDGIKWTIIESVTPIEQEWTHIAATLDGSTIGLYINGNLESTKQIQGIPYMNSYGFLEPQTVEGISSDNQILIGAQQTTKRGEIKSSGFFSGLIDEILIEDELFNEEKIIELCEQSQHFSV